MKWHVVTQHGIQLTFLDITLISYFQNVTPKVDGMCIVIFNEESQSIQEKLTLSVTKQKEGLKDIQKTVIQIGSINEIGEIPLCDVYLVYISKHPRNIILEHPDKDPGMLRRSVVEALIKKGGKFIPWFTLIVHWVGDMGIHFWQEFSI